MTGRGVSKPKGPLSIDYSVPNALTRSWVVEGSRFVSVATGEKGGYGGSQLTTVADSRHGTGLVFNGTDHYFRLPSPAGFGDDTGRSVIVLVASWTDTGTSEWIYSMGRTTDNNPIIGIIKDGAYAKVFSRGSYSGSHYNETGTTAVNDGKPHTFVLIHNRLGGTTYLYIDGELELSAVSVAETVTYDRETIGALERDIVSNFFAGTVYFAGQVPESGIVSPEEGRIISMEPYRSLKPKAQILSPALASPALAITTPPPVNATDGYQLPDPRFEEPVLLGAGIKPTGPVVIDKDQLVFGVLNGRIDHANNTAVGHLNGLVQKENYLAFDGVNDIGVFDGSRLPKDMNSFHFVGEVMFTKSATNNPVFASALTANYDGLHLYRGATNLLSIIRGDGLGVGPGNRRSINSPSLAQDVWHKFAFSVSGLVSAVLYINGVEQSLTTSGTAPSLTKGGTGNATLGRMYLGGAYSYAGMNLRSLFLFDGVLTESEVQSLSLDPYQFLIPA